MRREPVGGGAVGVGDDDAAHFASVDAGFAYSSSTDLLGDVAVCAAAGRWIVGDPRLDAELSVSLGNEVRVVREGAVPHQDAGAISIVGTATLAWCAERWGIDAEPRRLQANVIVATDDPFIEEEWIGRTLEAGTAALRIVERIQRCRTIDLEQDGVGARGE